MYPFLSAGLFAGQRLVIAGLQRWVFDPYKRMEQRGQRASFRALIILLVKTAATGMLAALLDAAIEYRTRQLLAAADDDGADVVGERGPASPSRLASLGMLSRAGVSSWKSTLLQAIDEIERRAELYGLATRCGSSADAGKVSTEGEDAKPGPPSDGQAAPGGALPRSPSDAERGFLVSSTIQQLQDLMRESGSSTEVATEEAVEREVDRLLDTLLGPGDEDERARDAGLEATRLVAAAGRSTAGSRCGRRDPGQGAPEACDICMDAVVQVGVAGCGHGMCFGCARRVCQAREHALPACPFCRQEIEGFELWSLHHHHH